MPGYLTINIPERYSPIVGPVITNRTSSDLYNFAKALLLAPIPPSETLRLQRLIQSASLVACASDRHESKDDTKSPYKSVRRNIGPKAPTHVQSILVTITPDALDKLISVA